MPQKKKSKKVNKNKKKNIIIGYICGGIVIILVIIIVVAALMSSRPKKVKLEIGQSISVSSMTLAIAMDRLSGGGYVTPDTCETFRTLAKQYDEKTDWFRSSYCQYIIYGDYNDTENSTTITLSDGTHAAIYTFNADRNELEDYKFIESSTMGKEIFCF